MKRLLFAFGLFLLSFSAQAATCSVTAPLAKDATASPQTFNVPYVDDGSGSGGCQPKIFVNGQAVTSTVATWTSATAANTNVDITNSGNYPNVLVTLDYGTTSAGAVTLRGKKPNGSYENVPAAQVLNKSTCASLTNAYSLLTGGQTGASAQDFLVLTNGYQTINVDLTSQATGLSGNLVVTATLVPSNAVLNCLPNPLTGPLPNFASPPAIIPTAGTTGAATISSAIAPATPAGVNLKASAGTVYSLQATTIQSTPVYVKLYNSASAPTCGSGTPVARFMVPAASTAANGAGTNIQFPVGAAFGTGIGYCVTGALADNDTTAITASNTLVNIEWQ